MKVNTLNILDGICVTSEDDGYTLKSVFVGKQGEKYTEKRQLAIDAIVNSAFTVELNVSLPGIRVETVNAIIERLDKTGKCIQDGITYTETEDGLLIMK